MKRAIILTLLLVGLFLKVQAQDNNKTFGVGFQSSFPIYGASIKYALTDNHVLQGTIAPFGIGDYKLNYFGLRYNYRFIPENENNLYPYLFANAGLINYNLGYNGNQNFVSYGAGGGLEYIAFGTLGISVDMQYGKLNVNSAGGFSGIFFGGGFHYYIK